MGDDKFSTGVVVTCCDSVMLTLASLHGLSTTWPSGFSTSNVLLSRPLRDGVSSVLVLESTVNKSLLLRLLLLLFLVVLLSSCMSATDEGLGAAEASSSRQSTRRELDDVTHPILFHNGHPNTHMPIHRKHTHNLLKNGWQEMATLPYFIPSDSCIYYKPQ